jgi:large subunit ribosomal protein L10
MKNRDQKKKDFEKLKKDLEQNPNVFLTGFEKMTVDQDHQLRKTIREAGGGYRVVKNNIVDKATEGTAAADLAKNLRGMTSMAYTAADPVALAKALTKYAKENPAFTFKAGMVEGRVVDVRAIQDLANLPAKEELYAKMLFLINASAQRLVTTINGVGRNLAVAVDQGVQQGKFQQ